MNIKSIHLNLLCLLFFSTVSFSLSAQSKTVTAQKANQKKKVEMTFENSFVHLGKVKRGESRKFDFVFLNTGSDPIEIDIISSCDCTTLDWPRKPIKPGQKGIINVTFDSTKKEASETIDVDIYLKNIDPKTGYRTLKVINYDYELTK